MRIPRIIPRFVRWAFAKVSKFMFILRRIKIAITCPDIIVSPGVFLPPDVHLQATDGGSISLADNVQIGRGVSMISQFGKIAVGQSVYIGPWTTITSKAALTIGSNSLIAERVTIRDQDHAIHGDIRIPINQSGFNVAPIVIEDDVWIGAGAVILKGVTIGRGAVIAANAVVVDDVEEYVIVGGIPAKAIGKRYAKK